jgi:hypothetical protein
MFMRVTHVLASPEQLERTITEFEERVMPVVRQAEDYAGSALFVNRATGEASGVTFWQSAQALAASGPVGSATRTQAAAATGFAVVDVERFQVVFIDRAGPARTPSYTRVDNGHTAPERLDDFANFVRDNVVPALRRLDGYRSTTIGVDRTSGAVMVRSDWETAEDREASNPSFVPVLQRAAEFTLNPIRVDLFEQVVAELL